MDLIPSSAKVLYSTIRKSLTANGAPLPIPNDPADDESFFTDEPTCSINDFQFSFRKPVVL